MSQSVNSFNCYRFRLTIINRNLNFDNQTIKCHCKNYLSEYVGYLLRLSSMHVNCTVCDESFRLNLTARLFYMNVSFKTNASENKVERV